MNLDIRQLVGIDSIMPRSSRQTYPTKEVGYGKLPQNSVDRPKLSDPAQGAQELQL